ncbi:MAG: UvrD-helicase domain-containing protein [Lachnospiraceae bacterium]|nr:UvrD-helicase domain-containing protein [Lachnospiraceae bacterium]
MDLTMLNENQKLGVTTTKGPVLILAGAGSGKTRVLTYRAAYLIEQGVNPYNIMAITFTNKAASEMRSRIDQIVGHGSSAIWVATFHSTCVRILRRFADRIGYDTNFTIYDADDSKKLCKEVLKKLDIDSKLYPEKRCLSEISSAKDELVGYEKYLADVHDYGDDDTIARVYREYQIQLKENNAMDFDDLIMLTVELFKKCDDVLKGYHERFQYVMVDEYQDTNTAQFELIKLLAGGSNNLCVVGDDDQSIYKFRGANIYNILNFEDTYEGATVIKLEENYRSTPNILNVANAVIKNNIGRKDKSLWTEADEGEKVRFSRCDSAYEEAEKIVGDIDKMARLKKYSYGQSAILYRTNAQSRILEEKLIQETIPYRIIGGINFYARKEIKDLISYMKVISNPKDDLALLRIINVPKRGIGQTTINKIQDYAWGNNISFNEAMNKADKISSLSKATATKVTKFAKLLNELSEFSEKKPPSDLLERIIEETEYVELLKNEKTEEAKARIENIDELVSKVYMYEERANDEGEEISLDNFLAEVSLVADIDGYEDSDEVVVLMTLHSSKGLEFPNVYIPGMEENLFPSGRSLGGPDEAKELEEERRLCYVGITRAEERLTLLSSAMRPMRGQINYNAISRFVKEIPKDLLDGNVWEPTNNKDKEPVKISDMFSNHSRKPVAAQKYSAKNFGSKINKQPLSYEVGDRVKHFKFGEGEVKLINDGGRDYEVTVDFDDVGTKKMFASFAKLTKV